jgi:hypothetical protein
MHDDLTEAERDHAADLAYAAERFAAAYYGDDPEWLLWMRDLRDAFDRVYDPEFAAWWDKWRADNRRGLQQ